VNLFTLPAEPSSGELFERLAGGGDVLVERIVSTGQATPLGEWLEQERDEWVVVVQGEAEVSFADGSHLAFGVGDDAIIPAGTRHRVERTSTQPPCIWLAVHASDLAR
jgi:cupin 2 domain-containing protein